MIDSAATLPVKRAIEYRKGEERRPKLSDLRDSGQIEADADVVLFLYRPEIHDPTNRDLQGQTELIVAKQRDGDIGIIGLHFSRSSVRFDNLATDFGSDPQDDWPRPTMADIPNDPANDWLTGNPVPDETID